MKDYCAETLRKERRITIITLLIALLMCTIMLILLIQDVVQGDFQTGHFIFMAVIGPVEIVLLVKMFRSPFRAENLTFVQKIRKQQPEGRQDIPLDYIFREINDDLNGSGIEVGPFLLGEKWLLVKTDMMNHVAMDISQLQGFAMGRLRQGDRDSKRKPALVLLSGKLGLVKCFSSRDVLRQFYNLLKSRYPELTSPGDEDTKLGEWSMRHALNAWQNRPGANP